MAVQQKGIGVAWGITSSGYAGTTHAGVGYALTTRATGQTLRKSADSEECRDLNGEVVGKVFFNQTSELTLRVYPSGVSISAANTANVLPAIGDKMIVTDASDSDIAGTYLVEDCSKTRTNNAKVEFDVTLRRYPTDISAPIT